MHASTVALVLFASTQAAFAAPMPAGSNSNNARSLSAIGDAISGFAEDVLGPTTAKRDIEERSLSAIENFFSNLKRDEQIDARSLSAIENFIGNLKRGEDVDARSLSAIEGVVHDIFGKRSLKAVGAAVAGGVASGVAGAVGNAVLNNKRSESGLMVDTETGTLYMDVLDANEGRSLKAVGAAVAGGVAAGAAGAIGNAVLNNKRSDVMVDTDTGIIYMDVPDANGARSLKAVGTAVAGGVAAGAAGAIGNAVLGNRDVEDIEARSLKAVGTAVAGGVAAGVAGAVGNAVLNNKRAESGLMVDTDTGVLYMDVPDENGARSLKAVGAAVAGGVAAGAAGAIGNAVLGNRDVEDIEARSLKAVGAAVAGGVAAGAAGAIGNAVLNNKRSDSGLMVDTDTGVLYMDVPDANDGRSLKAVGTAVAGGVAAGAVGAIANNVLGNRDVQETEARSLKAVGAAVAGGVAAGAAGAIGNAVLNNNKRFDVMVDTDTGVIYMDIPDENGTRSLKAVGAAVAGGVAAGAAGAIGNAVLNNKRSDLMVDTDTGILYMDVPDANGARSLKAVGTAVAGGIATGVASAAAGSILNRDTDDFPILPQGPAPCKRSELAEMMAKRFIDDLE